MELGVSGRSSWRCMNISELARQIDPQVSEISLFAVLWFRIDQSLISTVVPISIPGMSGSGYLPCEHWLWLYNIIQWERREHAFLADDEWSGSSRCVYTRDGIATRFCPLQFENCTCTLYSSNDIRVNDAHLQTLLSNMQKKITQNVTTCEEICSSLPTTMSVCDEQNSSKSIMAHIQKKICPFGQHHMLETSWTWMEIFPTVIKCHSKCSVKMMGLLMTTMTLVMNALQLLQCSMWCSNSYFNLLIGAACQMQPWVSLLTFLDNFRYVFPD